LLQQNADVVGFCEANKWRHNLSGIAAAAGYAHAEMFPTSHGYPLAVFSKTHIKVIGRHEEHFERGVLHVQILGIHFFIAHLNAHNSTAREGETTYLGTLVRRVTAPVVVMGDMNTLSPLDDKKLQSMVAEDQPLLHALFSLPCYRAMRRKFLQGPQFKRFNYKPMINLLEAGLVDASSMRVPTEPTNIPCDQASYCDCPHLRLDYMLVSTQFAAMDLPPTAHVVIDDRTKMLSDHFPIELKVQRGNWY
jgi:endonuclease/exonuclease/phosphatase family metal-dependent hydrolase